jgi:hypothetical protein
VAVSWFMPSELNVLSPLPSLPPKGDPPRSDEGSSGEVKVS